MKPYVHSKITRKISADGAKEFRWERPSAPTLSTVVSIVFVYIAFKFLVGAVFLFQGFLGIDSSMKPGFSITFILLGIFVLGLLALIAYGASFVFRKPRPALLLVNNTMLSFDPGRTNVFGTLSYLGLHANYSERERDFRDLYAAKTMALAL